MTPVTGPPEIQAQKLPLWRAICGFAVLGSLALVLLSVASLYVENYRFTQFVGNLASQPGAVAAADDALRPKILERARQLNLPVQPGDIQIGHSGGKLQLACKYKVQLYHLDLHFHPEAVSR